MIDFYELYILYSIPNQLPVPLVRKRWLLLPSLASSESAHYYYMYMYIEKQSRTRPIFYIINKFYFIITLYLTKIIVILFRT